MKKNICIFLLLLLILFFLCSCHDRLRTEGDFVGGSPVSVDDLESIRDAIEAANETESVVPSKIVYWVDGGSGTTYHTHADCPYLQGKNVASGEKIDAFAACKMDLCSRCAARDGR